MRIGEYVNDVTFHDPQPQAKFVDTKSKYKRVRRI